MSLLSRAAILAAPDTKYRIIDVPEWGEDAQVRLKSLSGADRDAYEESQLTMRSDGRMIRDGHNARAKLIVRSIVDENGERVFKDNEAAALGEKSQGVLDRLFVAISEMSNLTEEDIAELGKDSEADPTGDSPSTSPSDSAAQ